MIFDENAKLITVWKDTIEMKIVTSIKRHDGNSIDPDDAYRYKLDRDSKYTFQISLFADSDDQDRGNLRDLADSHYRIEIMSHQSIIENGYSVKDISLDQRKLPTISLLLLPRLLGTFYLTMRFLDEGEILYRDVLKLVVQMPLQT